MPSLYAMHALSSSSSVMNDWTIERIVGCMEFFVHFHCLRARAHTHVHFIIMIVIICWLMDMCARNKTIFVHFCGAQCTPCAMRATHKKRESNSKQLVAFHCGGKCEHYCVLINNFMRETKRGYIFHLNCNSWVPARGPLSATAVVVMHTLWPKMHIDLIRRCIFDVKCEPRLCNAHLFIWNDVDRVCLCVAVCSLSFLYVVISTIRHMGSFVRSIFDTRLVQPAIYIENKAMHSWNHLEMGRNMSECDERKFQKFKYGRHPTICLPLRVVWLVFVTSGRIRMCRNSELFHPYRLPRVHSQCLCGQTNWKH